MTNTIRTQNVLLNSIFQDGQANGSITAQDMRDFVVSSFTTGRQKIINDINDLPAAVGNVITLEAATDYLFVSDLDLGTSVFSLIDGSSFSASSPLVSITTASATALITATEALEINNITLINSIGPCINVSATGSNSISLNRVRLLSTTDDNFGGSGAGLILNDVVWIATAGGVIFSGTWIQVLLRGCIWGTRAGTGTALTLASGFTTSIFNLSETQFNMSTGQTALDIDAGITPTTSGAVNNCIFALAGTAVALVGITTSSTNWSFTSNHGINNTPVHGWENIVDSTYDALDGDNNKLAIAVDTRTQLTIDGLGSGTSQAYVPNSGIIWDTSSNKITPQLIGACYDLRLQARASYDTEKFAHVDLEIDIGAPLNSIYIEQKVFAKGADEENNLSWSIPIFVLDTFVANGGSIYITPRLSGIKMWDIRLLIVETYNPGAGV